MELRLTFDEGVKPEEIPAILQQLAVDLPSDLESGDEGGALHVKPPGSGFFYSKGDYEIDL